jgi:hypothetical protein
MVLATMRTTTAAAEATVPTAEPFPVSRSLPVRPIPKRPDLERRAAPSGSLQSDRSSNASEAAVKKLLLLLVLVAIGAVIAKKVRDS